MLLRIGVVVLGTAYIAYRIRLALQLARARRTGDVERERALRKRSTGILRWAAGLFMFFFVLLVLLVLLETFRTG